MLNSLQTINLQVSHEILHIFKLMSTTGADTRLAGFGRGGEDTSDCTSQQDLQSR